MDILTIIIIVAGIIIKAGRSKEKKKPTPAQQQAVNSRNQQKKQMESSRKAFEEQQQQARYKQQQIRQAKPQTTKADKQKELKKRLEEKYTSYRPQTYQKPVKTENTILERAKGNVEEDAVDELKELDTALHQAAGAKTMQENAIAKDLEEDTLMDQVYDLMVTGYNGNMEFDRDFLAEAMDMLNRIQG